MNKTDTLKHRPLKLNVTAEAGVAGAFSFLESTFHSPDARTDGRARKRTSGRPHRTTTYATCSFALRTFRVTCYNGPFKFTPAHTTVDDIACGNILLISLVSVRFVKSYSMRRNSFPQGNSTGHFSSPACLPACLSARSSPRARRRKLQSNVREASRADNEVRVALTQFATWKMRKTQLVSTFMHSVCRLLHIKRAPAYRILAIARDLHMCSDMGNTCFRACSALARTNRITVFGLKCETKFLKGENFAGIGGWISLRTRLCRKVHQNHLRPTLTRS